MSKDLNIMRKDLNIMLVGFGGKTAQCAVFGRSCEAAGESMDSRRSGLQEATS
ncbi:MAG: hypothetical protein LBL86_04420 [Coriobacteriales bacterium]|jgi:hypothetical protein|nr:hypothetical protein [Coriobacteriales bacterium]